MKPNQNRTLLLFLSSGAGMLNGGDGPVSYNEHILPILKKHCVGCHGNDKQKAGLNLQSYSNALKGGSGGGVLVAGRSSKSTLYQAIIDPDDDSRMPPEKPPLPDDQIDLIRLWIDTGLRQASSDKSLVKDRNTDFHPAATAGQQPESPAVPRGIPQIEIEPTTRPLPVLSMDSSPWAPLLAVAGQGYVTLLDSETYREFGKLPFPEGVPHVIRFSRDGSVLLVAGGKPADSGKVALFDVRDGRRLLTLGDENDAIQTADISPDLKMVAIGGTNRKAKVFSTKDGKQLYEITKHTDWILALAFSPDGKQLATADRSGGLHLWDAANGGILLTLAEHKAAIRAIDWRPDGKLLASAGEDGKLVWWDTKDGWPSIQKTNAHPPTRPSGAYGDIPNGILAAKFDQQGNLVTSGRDKKVRVWDPSGSILSTHDAGDSLPLQALISYKGNILHSGDNEGKLHNWRLK